MAIEAEAEPASEKLATSVDWGKPAQPEEEAQEPETDWLSRIAAQPTPVPAVSIEEAPDWLSDIGKPSSEAPPQKEAEGAEYPSGAEDVPDWLRELGAVTLPSETRQVEEGPPAAEAQAPDWLRDLGMVAPQAKEVLPARQTEEPPPGIPGMEGAESEVPDWLARLAEGTEAKADSAAPPHLERLTPAEPARLVEPGAPELEFELPSVAVPPAGEKQAGEAMLPTPAEEPPEWLRDIEADFVFPEPSALPAGAEAPLEPEAEVPDWLRDLGGLGEVHVAEPPAEPLAPPPVEIAAEAPAEPEAEVPDWLRGLGALPEVPPAPPSQEPLPSLPAELEAEVPTAPEEEAPDWLRGLGAPSEVPPAPPPHEPLPSPPAEIEAEVPTAPEEEVPDWLRELEAFKEPSITLLPQEPLPTPSPELAEEAPAEPVAEIPDWLASLRGEGPSALEMIGQEAQPEEFAWEEAAQEPDWLAELRTTGKPDVLGLGEEVVEAEEETLPDWLAELRASQVAVETPPPGLETLVGIQEETAVLEVEEAVSAEYLPPELEAEPSIPEAAEAVPAEAEYAAIEASAALDWLTEIEAAAALEVPEGDQLQAEAIAPAVSEVMPESEKATIETTRLPGWLVGLGEEEGKAPPLEEEARPFEETLPVAELITAPEMPDWLLKLKPGAEEPVEALREEAVEAEDVLAGIPGVLPIVEEALQAREEPIAALRSSLGVPSVPDVEGAKLFQEIAVEPSMKPVPEAEVEARPESRRGRLVERLVWALIFIVLIVAVALALLAVLNRVGDLLGGSAFGEFFGSPLVIDPAPVNTFRAQVTKLSPNAVVVVSFDYSPATEAEMGPLAETIVRDLLENQVRVVAVSLRPEGAAIAQRLLEIMDREYPYAERTINLGYLPGQTAGVRSLAFLSSLPLFQNGRWTLQDYPAWQDIDNLSDVALIVAVADSPLAVRWWVEQMGPGTLPNRPMVAAVSTAADPTIRPYYNQIDPKSGQLLGLLSGIRDGAAYENRLGQPGRAVNSLAAQSVAHLGVVALSLGGTVVGFRTHAAKAENKGP
jgi:hypothetical protein